MKVSGGKRKIMNKILHLALAIELAVFQFAWPLAVVRAEEVPVETVVGEQADSAENKTADKMNDAEDTESKNKPAVAEENPEELWKTCKLSDLFDKLNDEKDCDECKKKTTCGEIEICLKEKIEIENDANIDNDVETAANTGENTVNVADVPTRNAEERLEAQVQRDEAREDVAGQSDLMDQNIAVDTQTENSEANTTNPSDVDTLDRADRTRDGNEDKEKSTDTKDEPENSSAEITTGDAVAVTDVVNEVNTTVVGENGVETVENIYGDYEGDINLLNSFNSVLGNAKDVNDDNEDAFSAVEISIENEADIDNDVVTEANTGENEIDNETENGDSTITTGDAIAVANVVNIVNNNIIGNNFLFTVINIFGNWVGDLIVPGEGLLSVPQSGQPENFIVDVQNDTNIENNVATSASSGGNEIETEGGSASVETGDAYADSIVANQVGSTVVANNWFFLAINNMGNWVGNVLNWNSDKNGYDTVFSFDFDEEEDPEEGGMANWITKIFVRNEADIENNIETTANTGENEIESEGGAAGITTGNAYAFSKIYNLVNNNFIGSNWIFATVNIFGSWKGNVEFAYPDLSVALADDVEKVKKGDNYFYNLTVKNNGRADSQNVRVGLSLPGYVEYQSGAGESTEKNENNYSWTLPGLKAGEEKTFQVAVSVSDSLPDETEYLESQAAVATQTKEVELGNNFASDQTGVYALTVDGGSGGDDSGDSSGQDENGNGDEGTSQNEAISGLTLSRSVSKKEIKISQVAKHTITVKNTGETTLMNIVVNDKIKNKNGDAGDYSWKVEKLDPGKKAVVTYKLMVNPGAPSGDYKNKAVAWGYDEDKNEVRSNEAGVKIAVSGLGNEEGENYYYTYYTYTYPESAVSVVEDGSGLIPTAEAAADDISGKVKGEWTNPNGVCHALPWWGWIFAGVIYLGIIHWSLMRQKKIIKIEK
ncbi:MAG: hypothetical protein A3J76_00745 [Candidatus Moranbacteria bacterium RBG_13_45_13]|nr:MAG: hypothetical protein A3J76_00745 [Candidatus Moranbacteria bacterium RBG_13_45_13]